MPSSRRAAGRTRSSACASGEPGTRASSSRRRSWRSHVPGGGRDHPAGTTFSTERCGWPLCTSTGRITSPSSSGSGTGGASPRPSPASPEATPAAGVLASPPDQKHQPVPSSASLPVTTFSTDVAPPSGGGALLVRLAVWRPLPGHHADRLGRDPRHVHRQNDVEQIAALHDEPDLQALREARRRGAPPGLPLGPRADAPGSRDPPTPGERRDLRCCAAASGRYRMAPMEAIYRHAG